MGPCRFVGHILRQKHDCSVKFTALWRTPVLGMLPHYRREEGTNGRRAWEGPELQVTAGH